MNISSPSLSALSAFSQKMQAGANNIANMNTEGYKAVQVDLASNPGGGVTTSVSRDQTPGPMLPDPEGGEATEGSNVNFVAEASEMTLSKTAYMANAKALQVIEETKGTLLDLIS